MERLGFWAPAPGARGEESPIPPPSDSRPTAIPVDAPPAEVGRWNAPQPWPVIAIHAALLPSGEVLSYSYPDDAVSGGGSPASLFDPRTGLHQSVPVDTDIFCSGLSFLADGKLYTTGGNDDACNFQGRTVTHTFDPFARAWTRLADMSVGRWYPTNVTLGDGKVLIFSGLDLSCEITPVVELYTPGLGLTVVPEGERGLPLYPRLHLLESGEIAHVGPRQGTWLFDPQARTWRWVTPMSRHRWDGFSLLVPGESDEVMSCGGSQADVVSATCERLRLDEPVPTWRATAPMHHARSHANAVILPDRSVLVIGGGQRDLYGDPVLNAERYDPEAETWTLLPAQAHGRMYHSTALLLPDGRVLTAGQDYDESYRWGEIYEPPYLFRGARPVLAAAPTMIRYGRSFTIDTPQAGAIAAVALLAPSTVTHSVDNSQRYVGLAFETIGTGQLRATAPDHPDAAPPGYYMLFLVDGDGVPSEATFVQLTDGHLFADGFERGDLANWSATLP